MMKHRTIGILGLLLVSLVFQGESCILEQRTISAVVGSSIPAQWHTTGFTDTFDDDTVDAGAEIKKAIEDGSIDVDDIKSISISGACYKVESSTGHNAQRQGTVKVNVVGDPEVIFFSFNVPNNNAGTEGTSGDGTLTLNGPGVNYLQGKLNAFLSSLKAGGDPSLMVHYRADWTSTPPPSEGDPDDFFWTTCAVLQIEYEVELEVPNVGGD